MSLRLAFIAVFLVAPALPQQPDPDEKPSQSVPEKVSKPPKVCSIPLRRIPLSSVPYMPNFIPKVSAHMRFIDPPAPPCEDEQKHPPISSNKQPAAPKTR